MATTITNTGQTEPFEALGWDDATFEKWRYIQDEAADQVAESIILSPHHHEVYQALGHIQKNNDRVHIEIFEKVHPQGETTEEHDRLVKLLNDYFTDTSLTTYLSEQKEAVQKTCDFFNDHAVEATITLAVRSLLKQYAAFKATNVLIFTRMLAKYPHRRILETMQFVMDVMDPLGYGPEGYAIRSIQKLRLVHAMIRARIRNNLHDVSQFGEWQETWGLPINQQDMIFAIHTFSVEVLDGLIAAGEKISREDMENYYLTWHYIGKALGVKDEINPWNYQDGKALQNRIYQQQFVKPNPNAPALAKPLLEFMQKTLPTHPDQHHIYAVVKLYNDKDEHNRFIFEEILEIPLSTADDRFLRLMKDADSFWHFIISIRYLFTPRHKKPLFHHALAMKNFNMLEAVIGLEKTWSGKHFRISDGFGDLAALQDEKAVASEPSLLFRIAERIFGKLEQNHPSLLVQILHKLFFKKQHKTDSDGKPAVTV